MSMGSGAGRVGLLTSTGAFPPAGIGSAGSANAVVVSSDLPSGSEEVVDEQDPDEIVEIVAAYREAAVPRLAHGPTDGVDGQGDGEGHHVDAGGHHLAHDRVVKVVKGVDDELLLGVSAAFTCSGAGVAVASGAAPPGDARASPGRPRLVFAVVLTSENGHGRRPPLGRQVPAWTGVDTTERGW